MLKFVEQLPEVEGPTEKFLSLKDKLKWTAIVLVIYFTLSMIPLYGLDPNYKAQFQTLATILAAQLGSIISLGIGPIVTGSIMLQLLVGGEILKIDLNSKEGRAKYEALQKLFSIAFIIIENAMFVISGALPPAIPSIENILLLIIQLIFGGFLLMLLDELSSKWGIGSGISLFIAAGVSRRIFVRAFNPLSDPTGLPAGYVFKLFFVLSNPIELVSVLVPIIATIAVFLLATYLQSIKVEIPLSLGRFRGMSIKWPLSFVYTSNIPVILTAALIGSLEVWGLSLYHAGFPILGTFEKTPNGEIPATGLVRYLRPPTLLYLLRGAGKIDDYISIFVYSLFMIIGSTLFSVLWVNVGKQDPSSVADMIMSSGLSIPGFRRDKRVLERVLSRYINPLAVMGGFSVGLLAAIADLFGALDSGTAILLAVMIIYQFYEVVKKLHAKELGFLGFSK